MNWQDVDPCQLTLRSTTLLDQPWATFSSDTWSLLREIQKNRLDERVCNVPKKIWPTRSLFFMEKTDLKHVAGKITGHSSMRVMISKWSADDTHYYGSAMMWRYWDVRIFTLPLSKSHQCETLVYGKANYVRSVFILQHRTSNYSSVLKLLKATS